MKLYKVTFRHYSQKDSVEGIKELLLANSEEEAFDHVDLKYTYGSWSDKDENGEYDPEDFEQADESYKARMIRLGGEDNDDEHEVEDLYYGATEWGWEFISDVTPEQQEFLLTNKLAVVYTPKATE